MRPDDDPDPTLPSAPDPTVSASRTRSGRFPAQPRPVDDPRAALAALFGASVGEVVFGRYHLLQRLGQGAMGVVHAAYDDRLDRKIALKRLRASWIDSDELRERTVREARALARLAHPNVVYVFEVGEIDDQLFVAMEFLAGPTLRAWLDAGARPWPEALAALLQAGEGLAAAHARGVVHRDFKPHNAMFGADGRVRVLDFGLARFGELHEAARSQLMATTESDAPDLTRTGAVLGTPAYMAPEQFLRRKADARSDQFSFCVALFEALYGQRPFAGETLTRLAAAVTDGPIAARPRDSRVPPWIHAVLLRGLEKDPERRWPSMRELLAALARDPRARARRRVLISTAVIGLAAAVVAAEGHRRWDLGERVAACEASGAEIDATWNSQARQRLRDAAVATGAPDAAATAERVATRLDARAQAWRQARADACMRTEVDRAWDLDLADRATWCLAGRRLELAAVIDVLGRADRTALDNSISAATVRDAPTMCTDEAWLRRQPTAPVRGREALQELRAGLAQADALARTGRPGEALTTAATARQRARPTIDWPPLQARARAHEGAALASLGARPGAEAALRAAYFAAASFGAWEVAADAATQLIGVALPAQARAWDRHAEIAISQLGAPDMLREARRSSQLAALHHDQPAQARDLYTQALASATLALGEDHLDLAPDLDGLARAQLELGARSEALAAAERALAIRERALGPHHPDVSRARDALARLRRPSD